MLDLQRFAVARNVVAVEVLVMEPCPDCDFKARSKSGLSTHRRSAHALIVAAESDDRVALLRGLIVKLAGETENATVRELPSLAHRLTTTSEALERELGHRLNLAELQAEVARLRQAKTPKESSVVDQIAERRARRRAKTAGRKRSAR